jgi:hypothetical protein
MPDTLAETPASLATTVRDEDGLVITEYPPATRVDLAIAQSTFRRRQALLATSGRKKHRIIIHGTRIVSFDYAAYRFSAGREVSSTVTAAALVCSSMLERHMASVFVNMWRPSYPVRIFEDMESARRWLHTFPDE